MRTLPPHWTLHSHDWVGSTNTVAAELAAQGAPEGTVVVAQGQDAGRGRWGRSWESPHGKNLYISVILRPKLLPPQISTLSLVAGLAGIRMLADDYQVAAQVKWPNDIWLNGLKVGGILAELQTQNGDVAAVILGLGLNVNARDADFSPELTDLATSLALVTGRTVSIDDMRINWCHHFYQSYQKFLTHGFPALQEAYESVMALKGEQVRIEGRSENVVGTVTGVDPQGWLQLTQSDGTTAVIDSGEVIKVCCSS